MISIHKAGKTVDGLLVRSHVPNMGSIASSFTDYDVLPGIYEVSMSAFDARYINGVKARTLDDRTMRLAQQISDSGELNPLIIGVDSEGPYVVEGGHRFDALIKLGIKAVPAVVVIDNTDPPLILGKDAG